MQPDPHPPRPKLLLLEFWGFGDLTFATTLIGEASKDWDITVVGKGYARPLLAATFPALCFETYDPPWTVFRGKYKLWKWDWSALIRLIARLRRGRFDAAVSVRQDPRDHLLMWLTGARRRVGFPRGASGVLLTECARRSREKQHRVEDWRDLGAAMGLRGMESAAPFLDRARYRTERVDSLLEGVSKPLICLHAGARIAVRRWPEAYFATILRNLRALYDFHLVLIPDPDGYGSGLAALSDSVAPALSAPEFVDLLGRVDLLVCNDSGPGHIAASCGRPTISIFGPTDPDWFRPWGDNHQVVIRDICPLRPCFDYCQFPEPYCLTKLLPETVWPEIRQHVERVLGRTS